MKKKIFYLSVAILIISATAYAANALDIGPYHIDLGIIDRILGITKLSAEEQNMNKEPGYKGNEYCRECHGVEYSKWSKSKHNLAGREVDCETCHGNDRTEKVDSSRNFCGSCHGDIPYRPNALVKVNLNEHFTGVECAKCHNPHNPWPPKSVVYTGGE